MTDRISGFVVTLEKDIRVDDVESTIKAIKHIKGVINVEPVVSDVKKLMAYSQAKHEIEMALFHALKTVDM